MVLRKETHRSTKHPTTLLFKLLTDFFVDFIFLVSNYLENDNYSFDMVVFDEASQIRPEEAINSIYRGKQVIIAGDSKQLPPTNFFNKKEEEVDEDEEDEDDGKEQGHI